MKIILIMGLPGSGKTTLANELAPLLNAKRLNAKNYGGYFFRIFLKKRGRIHGHYRKRLLPNKNHH